MATNLHKELTARSIVWLNSRVTQSGMRWGTEIMICPEAGWIADAIAFGFPQYRFCDRIKGQPSCWPEKILYIFETKVSRSDFNKSFSGKYDQHKLSLKGNLHYIVTPKDLIKPNQLPDGWGWLMQSGNGLKEIISPRYNEMPDDLRLKIGWNLLWNSYSYRASIDDWMLRKGELF